MKTKLLVLLAFTAIFSWNATAQRPDKSKIKALKIAHITEQLDLTEKEAQDFWPIYNAIENEREKFHDEKPRRGKLNIDTLSEADAKEHLDKMIASEEAKLNILKRYCDKLLKVLPATKVLTLFEADRSFRKKMIEQFKKRHKRKND